jgi:hypothetical protein
MFFPCDRLDRVFPDWALCKKPVVRIPAFRLGASAIGRAHFAREEGTAMVLRSSGGLAR